MTDVPDIVHQPGERGRWAAQGRSTSHGSKTTLLVVQENNGAWTFHGLGAPGVTLSESDTVALAESILRRVR